MDRDRFDALTRLLGSAGSRRTALGAVIGTALGGSAFVAEARKGRKKKGKKKKNPRTCFGTGSCAFPSDGLDFENCNLAFTAIESCDGCNFRRADLGGADLEDGSFQGVSFRNANLRGANLEDADVSGASFRDACLSGANFSAPTRTGRTSAAPSSAARPCRTAASTTAAATTPTTVARRRASRTATVPVARPPAAMAPAWTRTRTR